MDYRAAVLNLWDVRNDAAQKRQNRGAGDGSLRDGAVSGQHLNAVAELVGETFISAGMPASSVYYSVNEAVVPGYFRCTKSWDVLVIHEDQLVAAVEFKSLIGSIGNNFNNRMEEGIGSAVDLQHASETGLLGTLPPWSGYVFVLEDLPKAQTVVNMTAKPRFPIDPIFSQSTYEQRMEIYLRRLVLKKVYDNAWFVVGNPATATIREPCADLTWAKFDAAIRGRVAQVLA